MPELAPSGSETLVNVTTSGDQTPAGLTVLSGGATVAAFLDDSSGAEVAKLRIIGADGTPAPGEIAVGPASDVQVAALGGGGFAVSWIEHGATSALVEVQTYDATGHAMGSVQTLGTYNNSLDLAHGINSYAAPVGLHMSTTASGGYALAWSVSTHDSMSFEHTSPTLVLADATGAIEASVGISGSGGKGFGDYDMHATPVQLANGDVLVTWYQQADSPLSGGNPFAGQRFELFDAHGTALTGSTLLDPMLPADGGPQVDGSNGLSVAALADGHVVFAWNSGGRAEFSIYPEDTLGQGNLTGRTAPESAGTITGEGPPQVVATEGGGFAIVWSGAGDGNDLLAHLYTNDGTSVGSTFHLGDITSGGQDLALAVADGAGLAAIWRDDSHVAAGGASDASGAGVMTQVFEPSSTPTVIHGTAGDDVLAGGPGEDWINGHGGSDTLTGGGGADKFILTEGAGTDRVLDFTPGQDHLLVFDSQGAIPAAGQGVLVFHASDHSLWFDPDGAGPQAAQHLATLDGVASIGSGDLAAGFQPGAIYDVAADGSAQVTVIDPGQASWSSTVTDLAPSGAVESYTANFDDGSHWTTWFDAAGDQVWSTRSATYDAAGAQTSYAVGFDDGTKEVFTFDPHNSQPWQRLVDDYDASGRLVTRATVNDDGSYKIATFDVANSHPWSMVVDVFNTAGVQTGHWTYNDDGTFVG